MSHSEHYQSTTCNAILLDLPPVVFVNVFSFDELVPHTSCTHVRAWISLLWCRFAIFHKGVHKKKFCQSRMSEKKSPPVFLHCGWRGWNRLWTDKKLPLPLEFCCAVLLSAKFFQVIIVHQALIDRVTFDICLLYQQCISLLIINISMPIIAFCSWIFNDSY